MCISPGLWADGFKKSWQHLFHEFDAPMSLCYNSICLTLPMWTVHQGQKQVRGNDTVKLIKDTSNKEHNRKNSMKDTL